MENLFKMLFQLCLNDYMLVDKDQRKSVYFFREFIKFVDDEIKTETQKQLTKKYELTFYYMKSFNINVVREEAKKYYIELNKLKD